MSQKTNHDEIVDALDDEDSAFGAVADDTLSKRERYVRALDRNIVAPARIVWDDLRARVGLAIIGIYLFMGTVGPKLIDPPRTGDGPRLEGAFETWAHPLGTDSLGRDILASIVHATPNMLLMILAGGIFTTVMATVVGTTSGYLRGRVDQFIMMVTDVVMTIPGLPLVVILAAALSPENPIVIGVILTINAWAGLARSIRSQVLAVRENSYVEAAKAMGMPTRTVIRREILPNIMPYVLVNFVNASRNVIFASVGLYFIGVLPYDTIVNWGVMIDLAYQGGALQTTAAAHWLLAPLITVMLLSFGLIMFAQGTDRMFNPRVRARHSSSGTAEEPDEETNSTPATGGALK
ncbi:ABC transporter permease [Natronosalvus rutilus]|uniref:ABC transporter permease n=1 Tax=Natronosalvus rutilus TaxID=2953753 RepID=A0A9E7N7G0_9EURY|nr:ABC transporter permease [Natronosalvus rutilus]UTF52231.1 ABC transporter permease [Natronosalvus rutilus]